MAALGGTSAAEPAPPDGARPGRSAPPGRRERRFRRPARAQWMSLAFAAGSVCFLVGPFPGYLTLVGPRADAVTFFVGSLLFTAGGGEAGRGGGPPPRGGGARPRPPGGGANPVPRGP